MASSQNVTGTITASGQSVTLSQSRRPVPVVGLVQASGPAGTTFVLEASVDGSSWSGVLADQLGDARGVHTGTISLNNASSMLLMVRQLLGRSLRLRCTEVSGSLAVRIDFMTVAPMLTLVTKGVTFVGGRAPAGLADDPIVGIPRPALK